MLDLLTNAPREVRFGDRTLRVGALKLRELGYLQRWVRDHSVRPTVKAQEELAFLPEEEHREHRKAAVLAERNWPPAINSPEGNAILFDDPDGQLCFLAVMFRKFQPELTDEDIDEIAGGLSEVDFGVLVQVAFGQDDLDPKAARGAVLERLETIRQALLGDSTEPTPDPITESSFTTSGVNHPISPPG